MPNRIIKDSIKTSEEISKLTWFEEVLFYRLIVSADDYGRYDGRAKILKNTLFPAKDDVTAKTVEKALCTLRETGLVHTYKVEGVPILQIAKWEKHQQIRAKNSKYPAPEDADDEHLLSDDINCNQMISNAPEYEYEYENRIRESNTKAVRHKHGEYKNVLLTDAEKDKLISEFPADWQQRIENLSAYMRSTGKTYKDHLATIRNWARKEKGGKNGNGAVQGWGQDYDPYREYRTTGDDPGGGTVFD